MHVLPPQRYQVAPPCARVVQERQREPRLRADGMVSFELCELLPCPGMVTFAARVNSGRRLSGSRGKISYHRSDLSRSTW